MQIDTTIVYKYCEDFFQDENKRILAMQGSTRASKTYNILLYLIINSIGGKIKGKTISIVRQTLPSLKATVERDFFEILNLLEIYSEKNHNKTDRIYNLSGNVFEFFSCDEDMKIRGRKRNILFCNEANELKYDVWKQLIFRTSEKIIIDYNPSNFQHWIYDTVLTRDDTTFHKVTYKDNPFLTKDIIDEIELLQETDYNLWRVYGLGERGANIATIFPNYYLVDEMPSNGEFIYGLDFGFNHHTALTKVCKLGNEMYVSECLYEKEITTNILIEKIKSIVPQNAYVYCDYSRPEIIRELVNNGVNAHNADKSVLEGIKFIKEHKINVLKSSLNLINEFQKYKWKQTSDNQTLEEPLKMNDDLIDSMRYALYSHYKGLDRPINKGVKHTRRKNSLERMTKPTKYKIKLR
jgi:phage terminase large subunit